MAVSLVAKTWSRRDAIETRTKTVIEATGWFSTFPTMENIEARQNVSIAGAGVGRNMVTETGIEMGVGDVRSHRLEGKKNGDEVGAAKGIATGIDKFELYVYVFLHFVTLVGGCWAQWSNMENCTAAPWHSMFVSVLGLRLRGCSLCLVAVGYYPAQSHTSPAAQGCLRLNRNAVHMGVPARFKDCSELAAYLLDSLLCCRLFSTIYLTLSPR